MLCDTRTRHRLFYVFDVNKEEGSHHSAAVRFRSSGMQCTLGEVPLRCIRTESPRNSVQRGEGSSKAISPPEFLYGEKAQSSVTTSD